RPGRARAIPERLHLLQGPLVNLQRLLVVPELTMRRADAPERRSGPRAVPERLVRLERQLQVLESLRVVPESRVNRADVRESRCRARPRSAELVHTQPLFPCRQ